MSEILTTKPRSPLQLLQQAVENVGERPVEPWPLTSFEQMLDYERSLRVAWQLAYNLEKENRVHNDPYSWEKWKDEVRDKADALIAQLEAKSQ